VLLNDLLARTIDEHARTFLLLGLLALLIEIAAADLRGRGAGSKDVTTACHTPGGTRFLSEP